MSVFRVVGLLAVMVTFGGCRANHSRVHSGLSDAEIESRLELAVRDAQSWDDVLARVSEQLDWEEFRGLPLWGYSRVLSCDEGAREIEVPLTNPQTDRFMHTEFQIEENATVLISESGKVKLVHREVLDTVAVRDRMSLERDSGWPEMRAPTEQPMDWSLLPMVLADPSEAHRHIYSWHEDATEEDGTNHDQGILYRIPGVATQDPPRVRFEPEGVVEKAEIVALGFRRPASAGAFILQRTNRWAFKTSWDDRGFKYVPELESGYLIVFSAQPGSSVEVTIELPEGVEIKAGGES